MKQVQLKNIMVLGGLGVAMFMCGMAYEHYTSIYVVNEIRALMATCPPVAQQLQGDAI
jgi:hypothetical protein